VRGWSITPRSPIRNCVIEILKEIPEIAPQSYKYSSENNK
jgi:hypothetical protein